MGFVPNILVLRVTPVLGRTPYSLARVGFGYPFDIFVLDNPMGFIPNRPALRITPVLLLKDTLHVGSSRFWILFWHFRLG